MSNAGVPDHLNLLVLPATTHATRPEQARTAARVTSTIQSTQSWPTREGMPP